MPDKILIAIFMVSKAEQILFGSFELLQPTPRQTSTSNQLNGSGLLLQRAFLNLPALYLPRQFLRPIFFGSGHKNLHARLMRPLEKREKSAASSHIDFTHDIIDEQNRRRAG